MNNNLNNDLVSIIMPAYNAEKYIEESILSVINQSYSKWELLIINDYSNDSTMEIVKRHASDNRIKIFNLLCNSGVAKARNIGMKNAKGKYFAFLDSDDIWLPTKLEEQLNFMKSIKSGFSYTQYCHFRDDIMQYGQIIDVKEKLNYSELLKGNIIGCLTVMIDRQIVGAFAMPNEKHEDYITWLQILKKGHVAFGLKQDLARYRVSNQSLSGNKKNSALWTWRIYRDIEKLSFLQSLYYFSHYIYKGVRKHF